MDYKIVRLVFETCEYVDFPLSTVLNLKMDNIVDSISMSERKLTKKKIASNVFIRISEEGNKEENFATVDDYFLPFDRIRKFNDIVAIHLIDKEDEVEIYELKDKHSLQVSYMDKETLVIRIS